MRFGGDSWRLRKLASLFWGMKCCQNAENVAKVLPKCCQSVAEMLPSRQGSFVNGFNCLAIVYCENLLIVQKETGRPQV